MKLRGNYTCAACQVHYRLPRLYLRQLYQLLAQLSIHWIDLRIFLIQLGIELIHPGTCHAYKSFYLSKHALQINRPYVDLVVWKALRAQHGNKNLSQRIWIEVCAFEIGKNHPFDAQLVSIRHVSESGLAVSDRTGKEKMNLMNLSLFYSCTDLLNIFPNADKIFHLNIDVHLFLAFPAHCLLQWFTIFLSSSRQKKVRLPLLILGITVLGEE